MAETNDTIAAIATPPGRGGVGIIRISGDKAAIIANQLVGKKPGGQGFKARKATFCSFLGNVGEPIDSGILIYYPQPASYTGEHVVELHGHGGRVVMSMLLNRVLALGARQARPGEFTERAFVNDKIDLVQAEAVAALIDSVSSQAARSAIRSLEGEFSKNINSLLQKLIGLRTFVESALDFPEEEIDFIQEADIKEKLSACVEEIGKMLVRARQGARLGEGLKLAIVGSPNVGKSSLLNRLAGREAAIVSTTPGTTRDIVEENILIDGAPLNISDTAGLRETRDDIEEEGIKRALNAADQADIILLVTEYGQKTGREEQRLLQTIPESVKTIVVRNKIDLADNKDELLHKNKHSAEVFLSAKTGEGVDELVHQLKIFMGLSETNEDSYMARTRHLNALLRTQEFLTKGAVSIKDKISLELLAEDLRMAQESLGTITGSFVADDLLSEIFSSFCIGK